MKPLESHCIANLADERATPLSLADHPAQDARCFETK